MPVLTGRLDYSNLFAIDPITAGSFGGTSPNNDTLTLTGITPVNSSYVDINAQVNDVNGNGEYNGADSVITTFPGDSSPTTLTRVLTNSFGAAGNGFGSGVEYALLVDDAGNYYLLVSDNFDKTRLADGEVTLADAEGDGNMPVAFILCFAGGTPISTPSGERAIETLKPGDLVCTADGRHEPIVWIGSTRVPASELAADPKKRPVRIGQGALGDGVPRRAVRLSRQHRVLLPGSSEDGLAEAARESFVPAIKLASLPGIGIDQSCAPVTYFHLLTRQHEVVLAGGMPAETLYLGPLSWAALAERHRQELAALNHTPETQGPLARREARGKRAEAAVEQFFQNLTETA